MQNISLKNIAPFTSYLTLSKLVLSWFYPSIFVSWPYRKIARVQVVSLESLLETANVTYKDADITVKF